MGDLSSNGDGGILATSVYCTLTTNPEISGIGVRVSFYIQGLFTIFGPLFFEKDEVQNAAQNAFLTTVAISITGFVSVAHLGMASVIDGILITFLPTIITVGATNNLLMLYDSRPSVRFSYILLCIFYGTFGIYFWANVDSFGTSTGCQVNSTAKFVLFGHSVGMTSRGLRGFGIWVFCALTVSFIWDVVLLIAPIDRGAIPGWTTKSQRTNVWIGVVAGGVSWIYGVTTVEQILQRNGLSNVANQWTFGQTLALALLVTPTFDLATVLWKKLREKTCRYS